MLLIRIFRIMLNTVSIYILSKKLDNLTFAVQLLTIKIF